MKAVAYSIKPFEKEFLARANRKKHDITLISNPLSLETAMYAEGKEAVIVFTTDLIAEPVIGRLAALGIGHIVTCTSGKEHMDTTDKYKYVRSDRIIHFAGTAAEIAHQAIKILDRWQQNKPANKTTACPDNCNGDETAELNQKPMSV